MRWLLTCVLGNGENERDVYGGLSHSLEFFGMRSICDIVNVFLRDSSWATRTRDEKKKIKRAKMAKWLLSRANEPSRGHFCGYIITFPLSLYVSAVF